MRALIPLSLVVGLVYGMMGPWLPPDGAPPAVTPDPKPGGNTTTALCRMLPARWYTAVTELERGGVRAEFEAVCRPGGLDAMPEEAQWGWSPGESLTAEVLAVMVAGEGEGAAYVDTEWEAGFQAGVVGDTGPTGRLRLRALSVFSRCVYGHKYPRLVHFIGMGNNPKADVSVHTFVSVVSAMHRIRPHRVLFHTMKGFTGPRWDTIRRLSTVVKGRPPLSFNSGPKKPFHLLAHFSDAWRLDTLIRHGGIYLDWDVLTLRSFDPLLCRSAPELVAGLITREATAKDPVAFRHASPADSTRTAATDDTVCTTTLRTLGSLPGAVVPFWEAQGAETTKGTVCQAPTVLGLEKRVKGYRVVSSLAVMVAPPQAAFLRRYVFEAGHKFDPECYTCHNVLQELTAMFPHAVQRMGWRAFQYPGWEADKLGRVFDTLTDGESCDAIQHNFRATFVLHLFQSHATFVGLKDAWGAELFSPRRASGISCLVGQYTALLPAYLTPR